MHVTLSVLSNSSLSVTFFVSQLPLTEHAFFPPHCANLEEIFLCKLSNSFSEMCVSCIKFFRILLNSEKCVGFTVLRNNLLNELTCTQFYNYVHGKIACKLDDFPLGSF